MNELYSQPVEQKTTTNLIADPELLDYKKLRREIKNAGSPIPLLRKAARESSVILNNRYQQDKDITQIVAGRAWVVDEILRLAWNAINWPDTNDISLIAVGGYGRGELMPYSKQVTFDG